MGKLHESKAKADMKDVREFEAERCLTLAQAGKLEASLSKALTAAGSVTDRADPAWLAVRNVYLVRVLLRSGFRRFEMHRARCADAVLDKGEFWTVGKGNIRDYVPLPASGINTLAAWLDRKRAVGESTSPRAFLFVTRADEPLSFGMIRLIWKEALGHAGLPLIYGIHTTRHTAGLIVFAQTGSLEKTARFLRHRSLATTARFYLHIDSDALRRELAAVDVWKDR